MKRVLIFSLNYYPFVGGAEVAIKEITDRLPENEYEFHMLVPRYDARLPKEETVGRVSVHRIGLALPGATITDQGRWPLKAIKYWYQFRAAAYAERLHTTHRFDLVWAMMAHATGIPAGVFKKRHPEVRYLLTLQEGDPPEYIERLMKPVWSSFVQAFTSADELQAISNFLLAWGRRMGFKGRGVVIPNGVDTKRFSAQPREDVLTALKDRLGKKPDDIFLVTTSRLVHKNAIDDVIRALVLLPENVSFLVYGIGPDEEKLKKLTESLSLTTRVRFMGEIGHSELPLALAACDIFVRPSRSEGMGISFIEAMAAGLPVIATQEGGIADFLFDERRTPGKEPTGWAVDVDAPEQIAGAVRQILDNPKHTAEICEHARRLVATRYDWDDVAAQMQRLFVVP